MASALGVSVLINVLSFVRQVLVAAYFGVERQLDVYFMVYAIATVIVFSLGVVFDTVVVPHLVRARERAEAEFQRLAGSVLVFSVLTSVAAAALFVLAMPLLIRAFAPGFSLADKEAAEGMAQFFVPWVVLVLPCYALAAACKSRRMFGEALAAEVIVALCSTVMLVLQHTAPTDIPLAFAVGYSTALVWLVAKARISLASRGSLLDLGMKQIYKNSLALFSANQLGSVASLVERVFYSYLPAGGISAVTYGVQTVNASATVLNFREIFIVPLAVEAGRAQRLQRLMIGLAMITVPIMFFVSFYARDVVAVIFERGKFDATAGEATAAVLRIYALSLLPAVVGVPVFRIFQLVNRIRFIGVLQLLSACSIAGFGLLFVAYLNRGAEGVALTLTLNCYVVNLASIYLLGTCGVGLNLKQLSAYISYVSLCAVSALVLLRFAPTVPGNALVRLVVHGGIYCLLLGICLLPFAGRIRQLAALR